MTTTLASSPVSSSFPCDMIGRVIDRRYRIQRRLGRGAYAQVYLAQDLQYHTYHAIKSLPPCQDAKQRGLQRTEIGLHARVTPHSHIIQLQQVLRSQQQTHLVLEYSAEGDLFQAITERNLYTNQPLKIRHVFLQLIQAVRHCHKLGVYHRDLKSENIMVFDDGWTVKLADFGLATVDTISKDYGCGSTFYFSPECQGDLDKKREGYSTAPNDIWSLGIILINLTTGRNPFHRASIHDPTFRLYMDDPSMLLTMLPSISVPLHCILKRLLAIDPQQRISLDELEHEIVCCPFFTSTLVPSSMSIIIPKPNQQLQSSGLPSPPSTPNCPGYHTDQHHYLKYRSQIERSEDDDWIISPQVQEQSTTKVNRFLDDFSSLKI